jgi:hypothetical protein
VRTLGDALGDTRILTWGGNGKLLTVTDVHPNLPTT